MDPDRIKAKVQEAMPEAQISVQGDGRHFDVVVVSSEFEGLPKVKQHRRVYSALDEDLQGDLHAVQLKTFTPEQYQQMIQANNPD